MEEVEPMLRKALADMETYSSLDGNEQADAMLKRYLKRHARAPE